MSETKTQESGGVLSDANPQASKWVMVEYDERGFPHLMWPSFTDLPEREAKAIEESMRTKSPCPARAITREEYERQRQNFHIVQKLGWGE